MATISERASSNTATASPNISAPSLAKSVGLLSLHAGGAGGDAQYFGVSSGVSLARMIETAVYDNARPSSNLNLPEEMTESPFSPNGTEAGAAIAPLPSLETGASFIGAYLSHVHTNFPFLSKYVNGEVYYL
jgi:hypothetical protein